MAQHTPRQRQDFSKQAHDQRPEGHERELLFVRVAVFRYRNVVNRVPSQAADISRVIARDEEMRDVERGRAKMGSEKLRCRLDKLPDARY